MGAVARAWLPFRVLTFTNKIFHWWGCTPWGWRYSDVECHWFLFCFVFANIIILVPWFTMMVTTFTGMFMSIAIHFQLHIQIFWNLVIWFCNSSPPGKILPLDLLIEYWTEHVTIGPLYLKFVFSTRIFYRGVPGIAKDCPCGVWCHGLATCLLYVGPRFLKSYFKWKLVYKFDIALFVMEAPFFHWFQFCLYTCTYTLISRNMIWPCRIV